jgi:zinc transport system substrate-binding protein
LGGDGYHHVHDDDCDHYDDPDAIILQPLTETQLRQIDSGEKILVAASVVPQTEFIEKVGGDRVIAISMIPIGAGHHYDPTLRQLEELSKARLFMALGSGEVFETRHMRTFTDISPNMKVVNSSVGIELIQAGRSTDSHIWTSPKCAQIMVENTYKGLAEIDPANATEYRKNADAYIKELQELDAELQAELSGLQSRNFMVYHPAWGYFARDYQLNQIAVEVDGKEPSPRALIEFVNLAKTNNITVIFVQEQVSVAGATAIAESVNGTVYVIDPLAKNYVENTRSVGQALAEHLN